MVPGHVLFVSLTIILSYVKKWLKALSMQVAGDAEMYRLVRSCLFFIFVVLWRYSSLVTDRSAQYLFTFENYTNAFMHNSNTNALICIIYFYDFLINICTLYR